MRIGIIASPYLPVPPHKYGGTERVIYYLIKGLKELGHEVILFAPGDSVVDCELIPICEKSMNFQVDLEEDIKYTEERRKAQTNALELLKENLHRIDVIHSHGVDIIDFLDKPHLMTLHGQIIFDEFGSYNARKDMFYNTISLDQLKTTKNLNVIGKIYNGLDPDEFPFVEEPQDYFSFLGRYSLDKSPHLAMKLALHLNVRLKVAAKIDFAGIEYYEKECKPLMNDKLIEDTGEQDNQGKAEIISKASLNLHPITFREPFGLTVIEAAFCGTPTLSMRMGALCELIEEGKTGALVDDFIEAIFKVDECKALDRKYIAERSRRMFNYKVMAKQYETGYENILKIYHDNIRENPEKLKIALDDSKAILEEQYLELTRPNSNK